MNNILSFEDAKRTIKKNKATIIIIALMSVAVYLLLSVYNYMSFVAEEQEEEIVEPAYNQEEIIEILNREPENILVEELRLVQESLNAEAVEFRVYIESVDQSAMSDAGLLKDFLILDDVVEFVESESDTQIEIDRDLAVIVSRRSSQPILSVQIRLGSFEDNMALAEAYMTAFEEEAIPLLNNREVYLLDDEPGPHEERMINMIMESLGIFSPVSIVVGAVIAFIIGLFIGVVISILKSYKKGKIDELSILSHKDSDTVLPLYRLKDESKTENQVHFAIVHPKELRKVVLSENEVTDNFKEEMIKNNVDCLNDVSEIKPGLEYEEVILLVYLDSTSKEWYNSQRIQLENVEAQVKVIQL